MFVKHNYDTENAEMLTIIMTFKHWQHYLKKIKHAITVITDHVNLQIFMTIKKLTHHHAKWYKCLSEFDFKIIFR